MTKDSISKNEKFYAGVNSSDDSAYLMRISPHLMVIVDLPMEKEQNVYILFSKNGNKADIEYPPKTDEFTIIKHATSEVFYKAYHNSLRNIQHLDKTGGEYFFTKVKGKPANGMAWYSDGSVSKEGLKMEFHNSPKDFSISIGRISTWKNIQHFRRAGNVAEATLFHIFFKQVFDFLYDVKNYESNCHMLIDKFKRLTEGERTETASDPSMRIDNGILIEKIENRIRSLEKRLMDLDSDTREDRVSMRGELEGLKFALAAAQSS